MIESADEVYLLADSSKLGKTQLAILGLQDRIDCLITDTNLSDEYAKRVEQIGIKVIRV